jgi:indolepyruvate ferredoxin oxidoreductase
MEGGETGLTRAVAETLYRVMAVKDEYEVARLYAEPAFRDKLAAQFEGVERIRVMLAPPGLTRVDPATGRPRKIAFGPWVFTLFRGLAACRGLRGTWADPFARTAERKGERALREETIADIEALIGRLTRASHQAAVALVRSVEQVRGYGPVKHASMVKHAARRAELLARLDPTPTIAAASVAAD